jgi:hypothetical protein
MDTIKNEAAWVRQRFCHSSQRNVQLQGMIGLAREGTTVYIGQNKFFTTSGDAGYT